MTLATKCRICGSTNPGHHMEDEHGFYVVHEEGEPIAFVVDLQRIYTNESSKARSMRFVRSELKKYYPGRDFEILPTRSVVVMGQHHSESHVATYIGYEK